MKKRFVRSGTGREWRKGRFQLVDLPLPTEAEVIWPRALWGVTQEEWERQSEDHISGRLVYVPEGQAVLAWCAACGGRYEALLDVRTAGWPTTDPRAAIERACDAALAPLSGEWLTGHTSCRDTPKQHHVPVMVQEVLRAVEKAARQAIAAGELAPATLYLLDATGRVYCASLDDLESSAPGNTERVNEIAARHFAIRAWVRARKIDLLAAIVVAEAWVTDTSKSRHDEPPEAHRHPSRAANRKEALLLSLVTPSFGQSGSGLIQRKSGIPDEGPGTVDPIEWGPAGAPATLLDTLFAITDVVPQSEQEQKRGRGVYRRAP